MAKAPPNTPKKGDRVFLRGRPGRAGMMLKWDTETRWCTVQWDDGGGPHIAHLFELERVVPS